MLAVGVADLVAVGSSGAGLGDLVIDLPEEEFAEVVRHARTAGLSLEEYARQAIRIYLGLTPAPRGMEGGPEL